MGWLNQISGLLQQYAGANPAEAPADVDNHFDQVAQTAPKPALAEGLAEAFRSDQTPPFPQMISNLFAHSNGQQRASILNQLIGAAGPGILGQFAGGGALGGLSGLLGGNQQVNAEAAERVSPEAVQNLAQHAEQHNPSIIDVASNFYAEHPGLVKTLGGAALTIAMAKLAQKQFPGR
jgi:hypothetical protein